MAILQREGSKRTQAEMKDRIMEILGEGEISPQNLVKVLGYFIMTRELRRTI